MHNYVDQLRFITELQWAILKKKHCCQTLEIKTNAEAGASLGSFRCASPVLRRSGRVSGGWARIKNILKNANDMYGSGNVKNGITINVFCWFN